jgi:Tol biopolymer transport system component
MHEIQLTNGKHGHTLNATQIFSPDGKWLVFDTRNDDTHISRAGSICKLNIATKEIVELYKTKNQSIYGPGVGAAAWNPVNDSIIFIHGLLNCDKEKPYSFTRRFGAIISGNHEAGENAEIGVPQSSYNDTVAERASSRLRRTNDRSVLKVHEDHEDDENAEIGVRQQCYHAEGRSIQEPFTKGALRGGTHAHTWSSDGKWISFTYNDYLMECLEKTSSSERKDLRTIGVMTMVESIYEDHEAGENAENFRGTYFAVVAAEVTEKPKFGSDEIERAFDECWLGKNGYIKEDGSQQTRAIAFQGNVRSKDGALVTEVFIADIPNDITQSLAGKPLEGTLDARPNVPAGFTQRRITFTTERKHPGLQGPRFRLRSSADGSLIYFLMKDDNGIVQIYSVSSAENTKNIITNQPLKQITNFKYSVQSQFNLSPDDKYISVVSNNQIYLVSTQNETTAQRAASWSQDGSTTSVGERYSEKEAPINGVHWSPDGKSLIYNRYVFIENDYYIQIFKRLINDKTTESLD